MKSIIFLPDTIKEIEDSVFYYSNKENGLEKLFLDEIETAINKIKMNPERYPKIEQNIRKYIINKFPFNIIFAVYETKIVIVAIAHQKRNPYYWKFRIG